MEKAPLTGTRVIDLTQAMAGPFATMLLGDLGCDIIKVEPHTGDQTRKWAPPYISGMSTYFLSANRNKRSIVVDLKSESGRDLLIEMVMKSDIIVENFRPGVMEKLGLGHEALLEKNPTLIYCSLSGYGQNGPYRNYPGYDLTLLSYSGLMSITGEKGRAPVKFGVPIADIVSGLFADISLLAALNSREKTGKGQFIDLSMLDANLSILTHQAFSYFGTGENPEKLGSAHPSIAPYQAFEASDGYVSIGVGTEKHWKSFVGSLKGTEILDREEFASNVERVRNREELSAKVNKITAGYTVRELLAILGEAGIPCAPINSVGDALQSEQAIFRNMVTSFANDYGTIKTLGTPFKMSSTPGELRYAPPMLGQHSDILLEEFGIESSKINELKKSGVINSSVRRDMDL